MKGRRFAIYIFSISLVIGVVLTLIQTFPTMCIGRFISGFSGGIFQMCNIKAVQETLPNRLVGVYGSSSGAFLAIGVFLAAFIGGVTLPTDKKDYKDDEMWRVTYAFPLLFVIWQLLMITLKWKYEPLDFLIKRERDEEALKFLPLVYNIPTRKNIDKSDTEAVKAYYKGFIDKRRAELIAAEAEASKVTFKDAVFGQDYYRATWMSACLNIGNQFSAIGPVCIYSSTILDEVMKETNGEFPITIREGVLIIGAVTMVSALLGVFPAKFMGRVLILTSSHMALAITHAIIAILYYIRSYVAMYVFM